ncbi:MAG TPA: methyltransferase domain-containing protein [Actinomycetota bacterium]
MAGEEDRFDVDETFDEDYLYFYAHLTPELSEEQADLIWRLLDIQPGMEVLDLACGHGRIANRLAVRGARVTGLDQTRVFLDLARGEATQMGVTVKYVEGDMRAIPWTGTFDRVVSWFTSFGYFDDEGNRDVLRQAHGALKPGGRFLVDLNHRDWLIANMLEETVVRRGDDIMVDGHRFDPLTGRLHDDRLVIRDGRVRRFRFFTRLFTFTEVGGWLEAEGFTGVGGYGEDGEALTLDHRRMIVTSRRSTGGARPSGG